MKDLLVSLVTVLFVCLFGYFVFPVIKVQRPYTKSYIIAIMWRYNNRMQSYNGSLKKKFVEWIIIQLVRNFQKTQKLKYCSTSSLLQVLSDKVVQKTNKTQEKKSSVEDKIWKTTKNVYPVIYGFLYDYVKPK